jgi:predicted ABC-type ATPase
VASPVLHLLAGPNGAGKSTLFEFVIGPATHLEFVNADHIARERWPDDALGRSYDAAAAAEARRRELFSERASFVSETVFSHRSKVVLVHDARALGYLVTLHVILIAEDLAVARVASRVAAGGHAVPEAKIRSRYRRIWPLIARAIPDADVAVVYDNSRARPAFHVVANFERGRLAGPADWPTWCPTPLKERTAR